MDIRIKRIRPREFLVETPASSKVYTSRIELQNAVNDLLEDDIEKDETEPQEDQDNAVDCLTTPLFFEF